MLARYKIYRGKRPADDPLPNGIRQDTRKHTSHCLRPPEAIVTAYLAAPSSAAWEKFAATYLRALEDRFANDSSPFDQLAEIAMREKVFLGCSCPTAKNPNVNHCHTVLALRFMREHYPKLDIVFPRPWNK